MEAVEVAEQVTEEVVRSQTIQSGYEIERGKPTPSKNHSKIQIRIGAELANHYGDKFDTYSELLLEAPNPSTVPDLCLFPAEPSNWRVDEVQSKRGSADRH